MSLFRWIILAGCVGALGLAALPTLALAAPDPAADRARAVAPAPLVIRSDCPDSPHQPPSPATILPDFDPEPKGEDEVWCELAARIDRATESLLGWCRPGHLRPPPARLKATVAAPRAFPIRC